MAYLKYNLLLAFILFFPMINSSPHSAANNNIPNIHYIGTWYGGFFASFMAVLNHLTWSEQNGKIPFVYWDKRSLYYVKNGFNDRRNVWEYYFKPVSHLQNHKPATPLELQFSPGKMEFFQECTDTATRLKAYILISKYIRPRSMIRNKVLQFYKKYMDGKPTIGIHLRGTDKFLECKLVDAERIISTALQNCSPETQFLIATDEQPLLEKMKTLLQGRRVIYYDCYRSDNGVALHCNSNKPTKPGARHKPSLAQIGEDVLVEALLLSKCDFLIHTTSNVSSAVLYFNPHIEHITLT